MILMKNVYLKALISILVIAMASCGGSSTRQEQLSESTRQVVSTRLAAARGIESPFETKQPLREYTETLNRATDTTQDMAVISKNCCDETRWRDRDALDRLWDLSAAASRLRVSLETFGSQNANIVPASSEAGQKIMTGGVPPLTLRVKSPDGTQSATEVKSPAPPSDTDEQGRMVFKRETVLRAQWDDVQKTLKALEELLKAPPSR